MGDARVLGSGDQDARMEEVGCPPGITPTETTTPTAVSTWVEKVQSSNGGGMPVPEKVLGDDFVSSRMRLEFPNGEDGEPVVTIGQEVLTAMNGLWKQCMIVKVLGRHVPIAALSRKLRELWKPMGGMYVVDLPRHFFMIRFDQEDDYLTAVSGGPWRVFGSILMVQAWSPDFDPLSDEIVTTPVWVRLSNLPVNFYHRAILMGIAEGLGKPIKVDLTTMKLERARFARVCVEVNLTKPLKGSVRVNGERYFVSYEGLSTICPTCGVYGHLAPECPKKVSERMEQMAIQTPTSSSETGEQAEDGFTLVRKSNRRSNSAAPINKVVFAASQPGGNQKRNGGINSQITESENITSANRFSGLITELSEKEINAGITVNGANKENEGVANAPNIQRSVVQGKGSFNSGSITRGPGGFKGGEVEKKSNGPRGWKNNGPKNKNPHSPRPARGLVFGPTREDQVLASSGKRLRVDTGSMGRPGGVFTAVREDPVRVPLSNKTEQNLVERSDSGNGGNGKAPALKTDSMEVGGANKPNFRRSIRYLLKKFETDILALFETHAEGERAGRICQRLGFENSFRVDAIGQSGGIWLLWRSRVGTVEIVESSTQFIHAKVIGESECVDLVVVYAAPTVSRRSGLWGQLKDVVNRVAGPLILGGDFNTILRLDERTGGSGRLSPDSLAFGEWINELSLIDLGFKGGKYTWRRGRMESTFVAKRLDRVFGCAQARLKWQEAVVSHLPFLSSDHVPLFIQLAPEMRCDPRRRPFRFEAAWLSHESFKELLTNSWNPNVSTPQALEGLQRTLRKWNKEVFGDIHLRKEKLLGDIKVIQDRLVDIQTDELLAEEEQLLKNLDLLLEQEETLWFQKSREKAIALGDRNTSFFHTSTVIRRRRNKIEMLKDGEGRWVSDKEELEKLAVEYYLKLYSLEEISPERALLPREGFYEMTREEKLYLAKPFTEFEVVAAVKSMGKFKAPGPDGYQPVFYQKCWDTVGSLVIRFVLEFFESGILPQAANDALIVLLAKVAKPERITQYRPVSLCNVLFKVITKMMVIRMKSVISKLIGPAQASFIPGRLSIDNIVVVQEAVHSMRRKKGRKGWMLLKLDLEKAYDRIRWDFLEETLEVAGFSTEWVSRIMACVSKPAMSLLFNGEKTDSFIPARGLRQGDPLSPYLFVLCLERLCHQIEAAVDRREWKPITVSRGGPKLSHICFADDLILFAEASVAHVRVVRSVLETFCKASGQKVSLEKSKIFFSSNVSRDMERSISEASGIESTKELGKYLGMPILQKRINKETFGEVLERVSSRLAGWKGKTLSLAGRITLTKSVLSSIPVHSMNTVLLPASTLEKLDKASRSFVWGTTQEKKKIHLMAWKRVCKPKAAGGLGLMMAKDMNRALLAKVGWRILRDKESLWARVLRSKYKIGEVHDVAWLKPKCTWSSTWRSIGVGLREVVSKGYGWVPGDELLPEEEKERYAEEYWTEGLGWNMERIADFIPEHIRQRLYAVVLKGVPGLEDKLTWKGTENGKFTVRSAYSMLKEDGTEGPSVARLFERIWRVVAPERVRVFLWLVGNQVILTNVERERRHMGDSAICPVCSGAPESIIHVLRDCPAMAGIWQRLVPRRERQQFFAKSLLEWVYSNLIATPEQGNEGWPTLFVMAIWWAWKWRCGDVFGERGLCRDRTRFVKNMAAEVTKAHLLLTAGDQVRDKVEEQIAWKKSGESWVTINTDGASHGNPGPATAAGALREGNGTWLGGFALNIGVCTAPVAELWGVYYGLVIAWEGGFRRVILEVDSALVVGFLQSGVEDTHPLAFLVRLCHGFISRDWLVRVTHVYREANRLADGLANYAFSLSLGFQHLNVCPEDVVPVLLDDVNGVTRPRLVRV
ncbi:Ribonuclease H-like superfamily [Arabidopsis thaliana x Arabidopsis arenosa]|uniref:Ribonuclease H-like superfamily n=1 Tax=Arabidopsis thaliana x Arabidopsis arenosa TaxID=1240361 RepID=A0A8T1ZKE2_9BRAS|nr:Ribonuclease H-like superfamily [Arabidopsis thaliana x Arabidopsis arenosa]